MSIFQLVFIYLQLKIAVNDKELLVNKLSFHPTAIISNPYLAEQTD